MRKLKEIQPVLIHVSSATVSSFLLHQEQERTVLVSGDCLCSFCSVISGSVIPDQTFVLLSSSTRTKWHLYFLVVLICSCSWHSPWPVSRTWLVSRKEWVWSRRNGRNVFSAGAANFSRFGNRGLQMKNACDTCFMRHPSYFCCCSCSWNKNSCSFFLGLKQENHVHLSHPLRT